MTGGYTGTTLIVDLSTQQTRRENTRIDDAKLFIGAKGLGAKLLIDRLPEGTDPFSPMNLLMFGTGPLTGTSAQTSGRGTVITKSPQTGLFVDSHFGGAFAMEMKRCGYDMIVFSGQSKTPTYITIADDHIEFKDAAHLWGMECLKTHEWLQQNEGRVKTAVIGPAGEHLVKYSAITFDGHRHAGRCGTGAVMGSKLLKAVTTQGTYNIPLHDPEQFQELSKRVLQKIQEHPFIPIRREYGTPFWVKPINDGGLLPTQNFQEGVFDHAQGITAETMQDRVVDKGGACWNCVIACWNRSSVKSGPFKGTSLVGPEYETLVLMGSNCGVASVEEVAYLNERCNELGMDTISLGNVLAFTIECVEKGILSTKDLLGINIGWGKTRELAQLIEAIAYRKNAACDALADGVYIASRRFGKKAERIAVHVKGLEVPGYDPRGSVGMGLAYATSDRGACHQRAWTVTTEMNNPEYQRFSFTKKAELVKRIQDERAAFFSLVFCDFAPISEEDCVGLWNHAAGFNHTVESYLLAGERIWNLIRLFNLREGMNPGTDRLPPRFHKDAFTKGPAKDRVLNENEFNKSLQEYYALRGWNEKGIPTKEKLNQLGLTSYAKSIGL